MTKRTRSLGFRHWGLGIGHWAFTGHWALGIPISPLPPSATGATPRVHLLLSVIRNRPLIFISLVRTCLVPDGHRTSTRSTADSSPNPKYNGITLCER